MHSSETPTLDGPLLGLAERAVRAARDLRTTPEFARRHDTPDRWNRWARRARVARTIAAALQVPAHSVTVTDDPHRRYRTRNGDVPGDLITVTDTATARRWRLITDFTSPGESWLILDSCPGCGTEIPAARIACLADLGDYLDPISDHPSADVDGVLHEPGCLLSAHGAGR